MGASGGFETKDGGKAGNVHIRVQQRNGRKSWTTVQGFPAEAKLPKSGRVFPVDFDKILRALKKVFKTNGTIIQLQGDIRRAVADFLIDATAIITRDQVM